MTATQSLAKFQIGQKVSYRPTAFPEGPFRPMFIVETFVGEYGVKYSIGRNPGVRAIVNVPERNLREY